MNKKNLSETGICDKFITPALQAGGAGLAQAINYAALLDVPFSFSSHGDGFVFRGHIMAGGVLEQTIALDEIPTSFWFASVRRSQSQLAAALFVEVP